jgi:hypothetical protein
LGFAVVDEADLHKAVSDVNNVSGVPVLLYFTGAPEEVQDSFKVGEVLLLPQEPNKIVQLSELEAYKVKFRVLASLQYLMDDPS